MFDPTQYELSKFSEFEQLTTQQALDQNAFIPLYATDPQEGTPKNYKLSLADLIDYIKRMGDYTNVVITPPSETPFIVSGTTLTVKAGYKMQAPNGFNNDGTFNNDNVTITADVVKDFTDYPSGAWYVLFVGGLATGTQFVTRPYTSVRYLTREGVSQISNPTNGLVAYVKNQNKWYNYDGTDWSEMRGMLPIALVYKSTDGTSITAQRYDGVIRNHLNMDFIANHIYVRAETEAQQTELSTQLPNVLVGLES